MNILIIDNGLPFNTDIINSRAIGGSELNIYLLAKGLSELDKNVTIINNSDVNEQVNPKFNIISRLQNTKIDTKEYDIIIFNRIAPFSLDTKQSAIKYYYSGDAYDQPILSWMLSEKGKLELVDHILCVSNWQKRTFSKYLMIPEDKCIVFGNCISTYEFEGTVKRDDNKLIFASIPYKGLDILPELFSDLLKRSKRSYSLHVLSSMNLYNQEDTRYEKVFSDLSKINGVIIRKPVSYKELAYELKTSKVYIHPNTYHETFGMILIQAQLAGCIPISTNKGAVPEVIINRKTGLITNYPNIESYVVYDQFIDYIINVDDYNIQEYNQIEHAMNWSYLNMAKKFMNMVN